MALASDYGSPAKPQGEPGSPASNTFRFAAKGQTPVCVSLQSSQKWLGVSSSITPFLENRIA
jgi:hypothetical protein